MRRSAATGHRSPGPRNHGRSVGHAYGNDHGLDATPPARLDAAQLGRDATRRDATRWLRRDAMRCVALRRLERGRTRGNAPGRAAPRTGVASRRTAPHERCRTQHCMNRRTVSGRRDDGTGGTAGPAQPAEPAAPAGTEERVPGAWGRRAGRETRRVPAPARAEPCAPAGWLCRDTCARRPPPATRRSCGHQPETVPRRR